MYEDFRTAASPFAPSAVRRREHRPQGGVQNRDVTVFLNLGPLKLLRDERSCS